MIALEPAILTIFGITGDLAKRKLLPALYHLAQDGLLPKQLQIVGVSRKEFKTDEVINQLRKSIESTGMQCDEEIISQIRNSLHTIQMDLTRSEEYARLKQELDAIEDELGVCMYRLFYLSIPATIFAPVVRQLGAEELNHGCQHGNTDSRLLIEKPFGFDLTSARELVDLLQKSFSDEQIYRIDHYLTKETVQNILTFRSENPLFKHTWSNDHVDHIMITAAESIGIEGRAAFYEQMGALRDLIQSHLLQLLALVTMDEPRELASQMIHAEKARLLEKVQPPSPVDMKDKAIRGQYVSYRDEVNSTDTTTETFAAVELSIDSDRWRSVPIYMRTGKSLAQKVTEVNVAFKDQQRKDCLNYFTFRIQPNEGIVLDLRIKKPGYEQEVKTVQMDYCYQDKHDNPSHPDAYERVLVDVMRGDQTLFTTSEEVLASWKIVQPILDAWSREQCPLYEYDNNSWGPEAADSLAPWLNHQDYICKEHGK